MTNDARPNARRLNDGHKKTTAMSGVFTPVQNGVPIPDSGVPLVVKVSRGFAIRVKQ
jgi:hypothetical protein